MNPRTITAAVAIALVVAAFFYGRHNGKIAERSKWQKALIEQQTRTAQLQDELLAEKLAIEGENARLQEQAANRNAENRRLTDEVRRLGSQTATVREVRIEVPGDCPEVRCPLPDIRTDYRLHNCAISPSDCEMPDPGGTRSQPGTLP